MPEVAAAVVHLAVEEVARLAADASVAAHSAGSVAAVAAHSEGSVAAVAVHLEGSVAVAARSVGAAVVAVGQHILDWPEVEVAVALGTHILRIRDGIDCNDSVAEDAAAECMVGGTLVVVDGRDLLHGSG